MRNRIVGVLATILVIALLVIGTWRLWPLAMDPKTGPALSSVSTAVTAVVGLIAAAASAVAAFAAMRAAQQSDETANHAIEALGLAMEPDVEAMHRVVVYGDRAVDVHEIAVWNPSRWVATDVEIIYAPEFGKREVFRVERLDPSAERDGDPLAPTTFEVAPVKEPDPLVDHSWRGDTEWENKLLVRYSDERRLLRWEKDLTLAFSAHSDGSGAGTGRGPGAHYGSRRRIEKA